MLRIHFGHCKDEIYNTEMYFENQSDENWVMDEFARRVIRDIDDSEVVCPGAIKSELFGTISMSGLSTGAKTLLLIKNMPEEIFNISNCGDNCAKYILELSKEMDITVTLHHMMDFGNDFEFEIINNGERKVVTNKKQYILLAHQYLRA